MRRRPGDGCWPPQFSAAQPTAGAVPRAGAGEHLPTEQPILPAGQVRDRAAGLLHDHGARRHVVGREVEFPVTVVDARRGVAEVEFGRAEATQVAAMRQHPRQPRRVVVAAGLVAVVREAGRQQGIGQVRGRRHPQRLAGALGTLAHRAAPGGGGERLAEHRRVHHAHHRPIPERERDGDREERQPVHEVRGAVERIDDPGPIRLLAGLPLGREHTLLGQDRVVGERREQAADDDVLGGAVGGGDQFAAAPFRLDGAQRRGAMLQQAAPGFVRKRHGEIAAGAQIRRRGRHRGASSRSSAATIVSCSFFRSLLVIFCFGS